MPELPDTLPEQMRALLPDDSAAVSAEEAMAIAAIRARPDIDTDTDGARAIRNRFPLWKLNPAHSRRPALAWFAVIAVLAVVLVLGFGALPSSKPGGSPTSEPSHPASGTTMPGPTTTLPRYVTRNIWPTRTITSTGVAQDIAPTADGVFWVAYNGDPAARAPVTPFRYSPASGRVIKGPSITGWVGSPAITVTGGWVWVVVGTGRNVVVEQLDISTLALHSSESLRVKDNMFATGVYPLLTATVNGPLWVAGGDDLWELNPTTGAIERHFDSGDLIASMSTDPTGTLLYTGGWTTKTGGMTVTQYDALTGRELRRSDQLAVSPGTVAATDGGVWVTLRTGNYGRAFELSVSRLSEIAPPSTVATSQGIYDQIGGVESGISEGTLWLTSSDEGDAGSLTCADPTTGAVRERIGPS